MTLTPPVAVGLNAVIITVEDEVPRALTVSAAGLHDDPPGSSAALRAMRTSPAGGRQPAAVALDTLPFGWLDPAGDATLEQALLRWVRAQTGLTLDYVEQLYTFGDRYRDPAEALGGPRVVSVSYLVLVGDARPIRTPTARWRDVYDSLPWEDWRRGRPAVIGEAIAPVLERWAAGAGGAADPARRERADITFGLGAVAWDAERVLERYELLYEVGLVAEAHADLAAGEAAGVAVRHAPWCRDVAPGALVGRPMAHDHRRILATALGRLRGKIKYRPVVFELLPQTFTLSQLRQVVEALAGLPLHAANFRRLVETGGLVEGTGRAVRTRGRPAELFRFRRDVLRERRAPGVGLPGSGKTVG